MSRGALHADLEERQVFFFPHFFPFFVSTWCRRRRRLPLETHFRSPLFFFFFGGCCARALLFHQPPTRVSSIIIIDRRRGERERKRRERVLLDTVLLSLQLCYFNLPLIGSCVASRCPSLTFQIGLGLQRLLCMDRQRSPLGLCAVAALGSLLFSSLLFSPCLCGISRGCCAHYLYIQTRSASSLNRREPNGHEK